MNRYLSIATLLVVALAFATATHAINIDRIDIIHNNGDPDGAPAVHIAEVQAFEHVTGINLAEQANGGVASYPTGVSTFGTIPGDANDGNTNGSFGAGSVWHSDNDGAGETFRIDLASLSDITGVALFGRTDCCQSRDDDLTVQLFKNGQLVASVDTGIPNGGQTPQQVALAFDPAIPEPASAALLGLAGLGLAKRRRRLA